MTIKRKLFLTGLGIFAASLLFSSCVFVNGDWDSDSTYNYSFFESGLRGTWERDIPYTPPGGIPETVKGKITINNNTIQISQDGTITHLAGIARGVSIDGYSKDKKIYIKERTWSSPASYTLWTANGGDKMLKLTGGSLADENFIRIAP